MKIVDYDNEHCAILVKKRALSNAGFGIGEDVYVVTLENGLLGVIKKSSFKEHLKKAVKEGIDADESSKGGEQPALSQEDTALLTKITSFKFEDRTPSNILERLSKSEKQVLKSLVDRGIISVYKRGRYKQNGVYTISKQVYVQVRGGSIGANKSAAMSSTVKKTPARGAVRASAMNADAAGALKGLQAKQFVVISDPETAKQLSMNMADKIKSGEVKGVRGFDSKYYIFMKSKYDEIYEKVASFLKRRKQADLSDISKETGSDEAMCRGILNFMLEDGDAIEKSKGRYGLV